MASRTTSPAVQPADSQPHSIPDPHSAPLPHPSPLVLPSDHLYNIPRISPNRIGSDSSATSMTTASTPCSSTPSSPHNSPPKSTFMQTFSPATKAKDGASGPTPLKVPDTIALPPPLYPSQPTTPRATAPLSVPMGKSSSAASSTSSNGDVLRPSSLPGGRQPSFQNPRAIAREKEAMASAAAAAAAAAKAKKADGTKEKEKKVGTMFGKLFGDQTSSGANSAHQSGSSTPILGEDGQHGPGEMMKGLLKRTGSAKRSGVATVNQAGLQGLSKLDVREQITAPKEDSNGGRSGSKSVPTTPVSGPVDREWGIGLAMGMGMLNRSASEKGRSEDREGRAREQKERSSKEASKEREKSQDKAKSNEGDSLSKLGALVGKKPQVTSQKSDDGKGDKVASAAPTASLLKKYGVCEKVAIGKGATAVVKVARDQTHEKLYAVKEFQKKKKNETEREYIKKLTSEFCISSTLHHPNVIETVDLVQDENRWCEVMEYCPGGDLYAAIKKGNMDQAVISTYFRQLIDGVEYLHGMGVAHRDIKPENLLLDGRGNIKITDFGVSDVFRMCWEKHGHMSKGLCGSEPYIAPEQFDAKEYDARLVDVWACAVVYYCMANQELPWRIARSSDPSYNAFITNYQTKESPPPLKDVLPKDARPVLKRMLDPNPKTRATTAEVLKDKWVSSLAGSKPLPGAADPSQHVGLGLAVVKAAHGADKLSGNLVSHASMRSQARCPKAPDTAKRIPQAGAGGEPASAEKAAIVIKDKTPANGTLDAEAAAAVPAHTIGHLNGQTNGHTNGYTNGHASDVDKSNDSGAESDTESVTSTVSAASSKSGTARSVFSKMTALAGSPSKNASSNASSGTHTPAKPVSNGVEHSTPMPSPVKAE